MAESRIKALAVTSHSDRPEAETLIGLHRRGIDLKVFASPSGPHFGRMQHAGIAICPLEIEHRFDAATVRKIRDELATGDYDILHLFNNKAVTNGLRAARKSPVKIIAYRGIVGNLSFYSPMSRLRYLNDRVDRIVCVAEAIRQSLLELKFFGRGLPSDKLITIHKGHDLAWYDAPATPRSELGLPEDAFAIGCTANWRPRKGIEVLVEAFAMLPAEVNAHLLLVGRMDGASLRHRIEHSAARDRIHELGYRADAPATIAACDVAVLPSLKREGLPKTCIEAMAYGVPPVVTRVGGSPELVEDGRSGYVVPPGDPVALAGALRELQADSGLRQRMGAAARERIAAHFPIGQTIDETERLYRELAATRH